MISFGAPQWFWALTFVPLLIVLYVRGERRRARKLQEFAAANLLPQLARTVNHVRRAMRFALLSLAFTCGVIALAQPRWGYTFEEAKRRGLDVLIAVDTSRSMLSTDVQPNRLTRVKLASHDLIGALQGDRVGLIAFAGRAFVQAPLTIDYSAAADAVDELDTNTIPEGGTNISDAIKLAVQTFGKSAIGNRALVIFTDGEELSGDARQTAKTAADAGVRIFTVGVGTPEGSLIPVATTEGGTAFVKDSKGQVVKSNLDETRLREIAKESGGIYLHLENGPATIKQLATEGLSKMQAGDINARMARRPIERYQWPLGLGCVALASWFLVSERKRVRSRVMVGKAAPLAAPVAAMLILSTSHLSASAPGIDEYHGGRYSDALQEFERTLEAHPKTRAADKLQFDRGAAAYKLKDYNKALDSFSQALLSPDTTLQSRSHYNLGNTLYERGESERSDQKKLTDWTNALQHYDQTLKLEPQNKEAKENYEFVKNKIEELKRKHEQQPSPTPSPSPQQQQKKQNQQQQQQQQQSADKDQQQNQQSGKQDQQKPSDQQQKQQASTPSPTQSPAEQQQEQQSSSGGESPSPSPTAGEEQRKDEQSQNGGASPSPSPGEGEGQSPSPAPSASPDKPRSGELKGASESDEEENASEDAQVAEAEAQQDGQMSEKQAELLLRSMKNEEKRVQLDERKAARHVYNDW